MLSNEQIDEWIHAASMVMSQFVGLTSRPDEQQWGMTAVEAIRLLNVKLPAKANSGGEVVCKHEPFEGRCVHCNIKFIDGKPASER